MGNYQPTIGLEIHLQLATKSKMFCSCSNIILLADSSKVANTAICPICLGHPGTLPTLNEKAIEMALILGLALKGEIQKKSYFERKNYFYPDLPKGYQISQKAAPLVRNAYLEIPTFFEKNSASFVDHSKNNRIRIQEIHLEEDTGRLYHFLDKTLIDFNRAGVPLLELVTEPDLHSAQEAKKFCQELQLIARTLGISEANLEKGEMRCEVNISLLNVSRVGLSESRISNDNNKMVFKKESCELMRILSEVYNTSNNTQEEKNYQDAIEEVLKKKNIPYKKKAKLYVKTGDIKAKSVYADFIIDDKILLEVKTKLFITNENLRQVLKYIKFANLPLGIIVNFKRKKLEYKRVINPAYLKFDKNSMSFNKNSENKLGTKVEIKNLNSFRAIERAIEYEIKRQTKILEEGKKIVQETRGWDEKRQKTVEQRTKEEAEDYRYFPEPDLPPLEIPDDLIEKLKNSLPELPLAKRKRFIEEYGFSPLYAKILTEKKELSCFVEKVMFFLEEKLKEIVEEIEILKIEKKKMAKKVGDWLTRLFGLETTLGQGGKFLEKISPENFSEFISLTIENKISAKMAQDILKKMYETGQSIETILAEESFKEIGDEEELKKAVALVLENYPEAVADYKKGKKVVIKYLIGQVMTATKGKANPKVIEKLLEKMLEK